jgi:hypothetical protein
MVVWFQCCTQLFTMLTGALDNCSDREIWSLHYCADMLWRQGLIVCTLTCPEGKPFVVTLKVICDLVGENIVPNRPDMHMRYFKYKLDSLVDVCLYVALCERFDDMCYATWRGSRRVHAGSFVYRGQRFLRKQKLAR